MIELCIYGRGGQGAQVAGQIIATALYQEGYEIQNFASYGGAIRGTLVSSYIRANTKPIRLRCDVEKPDVIVFFDASLIEPHLIAAATQETIVLVNTWQPSEHLSIDGCKIITVDALSIASSEGLGRIVNTAMVGAIGGATDYLGTETLSRVVAEISPIKKEQNVAACKEGYRQVSERRKAGEY